MAAALLRRSVATAGLAVLATVAAPLVGTAFAADPALTAGTFHPADGATVKQNRPLISVDYNTALKTSATTISVTDTSANNAVIPCAKAFTADSQTVGCTLSSDLTDGHAYKVAVHAENADSTSKLDESATWTVDIPSVVVASPADGSTVAVAQTLQIVYDETIDTTHSTVHVVNGVGNPVRGTVSVVKSSPSFASNPCPSAPCILRFTAPQTLPAGSYVATFHADGVTSGVPSNTDNPDAFADNVIHFIVNKVKPTVAPQDVVFPANITQANVKAVPFSGYAQPGFNVAVAIYDDSCDRLCDAPFTDAAGTGAQDGLGSTAVANCTDTDAHTLNGVRLCPFSLTVDDSKGCDSGTPETFCGNGDPDAHQPAKNQWYAYSYSGAGQVPGTNNPAGDSEINRDTTGPVAPDSTASGYVTNNAPDALVTVSATDSQDDPAGYVVRVADQFGHTLEKSFAPTGQTPFSSLNVTFTIFSGDGIDDGTLSVSVAAADALGNVSSFVNLNAPPNKKFAKEVVTLEVADPAGHEDSVLGANGKAFDFATLGPTSKIGVPSSITVHFNEPIALTVPNNDPLNGTPSAHLCLLDPTGFCQSPNGTGTLGNPTSDRTTLTWTAPTGFGSDLVSGVYTIAAFAPAANCATREPQVTYTCETSGGDENDPTTWTTLASFQIDKTAPVVQTLSVSPSTITPSKVKAVTVTGTSDPDTTAVQVSIKSSAGGPSRLLSESVTPPSDPNATAVSWSFFPVDLSQMRDGTLTISAFAIDDAGNKTPLPGHQITATLAAHVSTLTERASASRITYGQILQVSGRLLDQNGAAIKNATILVKPRFDTGSFGTATKATTDSTGHWGVIVAPAHNATWYASYAGSTTSPLHDAAVVHTARTLVRVAIAFTSPKNHATVGSPVTLAGKVSPNKRGATVLIYRHTSSGNKLVGKATLNRYSRWTFKLTLPKGTVKLFAVIGRTSGNLGNSTGYLTLTH